MSTRPGPYLRPLKAILNVCALLIAVVPAATCWIERRVNSGGEGFFVFWTHVCAVLPGHPGQFLRRAFYRLTLESCSLDCAIGFGALFSHRMARVESHVFIGPYAVIGCANLREGSLVGTRASLLSGSSQHQLDADGRWTTPDPRDFVVIEIGPHAWIGEAATVMADVGEGAQVAAAAVVSAAVPARVVVAGNPARFVRVNRQVAPQP